MSLIWIFAYQTITSISSRTRDQWGDYTTTSLYTNVPCRFVHDSRQVRVSTTEDVITDALAYIPPTYTSVAQDQVLVFDGETYLIVKVYRERDLWGNIDHYKLDLKRHNG